MLMTAVSLESRAERIFRYDLRTYHLMGELGLIPRNTELIYGVVVHKMTISPIHSKTVTKLANILSRNLPDSFIVRQEKPISINDSEPEPDISVIKGTYDDFGERHPETADLVIEAAYSSMEDDLEKASIYASADIPLYWIIDIKSKKLHIFEKPYKGKYSIHTVLESSIYVKIPFTSREICLDEIL